MTIATKQASTIFTALFSFCPFPATGYFLLISCALLSSSISFAQVYEAPIKKTVHLAQLGDVNAQVELATAYAHGEGIEKNSDKAIKWYCKAAAKGSVEAQRDLAWMFLNARGMEKNEALAVRWFTVAAKSGDEYSQRMLSRLDKNAQSKQTVCQVSSITPYWETRKCKKECRKVVKIVNSIAPSYNMDPQLILALIQQESYFNIQALSHKGATGLMQLLPTTAKRFGVKNIWDPEQNIQGGIRYMSWLLQQFQGNVSFALAGYNAGEKAVDRYQGIPPYKETQNYVKRIMRVYGKKYHPYEKSVTMMTSKLPLKAGS